MDVDGIQSTLHNTEIEYVFLKKNLLMYIYFIRGVSSISFMICFITVIYLQIQRV